MIGVFHCLAPPNHIRCAAVGSMMGTRYNPQNMITHDIRARLSNYPSLYLHIFVSRFLSIYLVVTIMLKYDYIFYENGKFLNSLFLGPRI